MKTLPLHLVQQLPIRPVEQHVERHLPHGVRGATEAGIVEADAVLDAVEDALLELRPLNVVLRNRATSALISNHVEDSSAS